MLKSIPKSNVSKRTFQVYKEWEFTNQDYEIISASLEDGLFETGSANKQNGIYTTPLYRSIQSKFYEASNPNIFNTFGRYENLANLRFERRFDDTIYVLKLPQSKYGEEIKPNSILFENNGFRYRDDGFSNIVSEFPRYTLVSIDFQTGEFIIRDRDEDEFIGTVISYDVESGIMSAIFNSDDDEFEAILIDLQTNTIQTRTELDFSGLEINQLTFGNVFYDEGLFVIIDDLEPEYVLNYRSTKTIYETEVLVTARAGEFNYSQNPSAIDVSVSNSYYGEITPITNQIVGTEYKKYKVIEDIKRKESYSGSFGNTTGSWDDYEKYRTSDPTGSYLAPYITTIGLYDDSGDMVAVAKLPTPIKNLPDYDMNFIVRFDT